MESFAKDNRRFPYEHAAAREAKIYPAAPPQGIRVRGDLLEVGPGLGHFLLALAEQNPDKQYVAIEAGNKRFNRICEKTTKAGFKNVTVMKGYAQAVIPKHIETGSFERVYVLFSDPWPKTRHARNRLLTTDFISVLACVLKIGGELFMATDHHPYARWIIKAASQVNALENRGNPFCDQSEISDYIPTIFEQKWRREGKQIAYMKYTRTDRNPSSNRQ